MNEFKSINESSNTKRDAQIKAIVSKLATDISATNDKETLKNIMDKTLSQMIEAGMDDMSALKAAMEGLNEALLGQSEKEIIELIDEKDKIEREIEVKAARIKEQLDTSFECAIQSVSQSNLSIKDEALKALKSEAAKETRITKIIKEAAQTALLGIVERAEDVAANTQALIGSMSYKILSEGEFSTDRIIHISRALIQTSIDVAEASGIYADRIVSGAILGARDGVYRLIKKLKSESFFAPDELRLGEQLKELESIDESFANMLKDIAKESNATTKSQIEHIAQNDLVNHFARLRHLSEAASDQIRRRIEEIRTNPKVSELVKASHETISELSKKAEKLKQVAISLKEKIIKSE